MKFFILSVAVGLLMPIQAFAGDYYPVAVPEPVSLIMLGLGLAGVGGAEMIRRRNKKDQ